MSRIDYLVRVGVMGEIWAAYAPTERPYARQSHVICRTRRGVEKGEIVTPCRTAQRWDPSTATVEIIREMTANDALLYARMNRYKRKAIEECQRRIEESSSPARLLDVDHLFDGRTLIFHFAGEVTPPLQELTEELADVYQRRVKSKRLAQLLEEGCGPGCGTSSATGNSGQGCGSTGLCAGCGLAGGCSSRA